MQMGSLENTRDARAFVGASSYFDVLLMLHKLPAYIINHKEIVKEYAETFYEVFHSSAFI